MNKKTVVLGASPNPSRYSYLAVTRLMAHGHNVIPIGRKICRIHDAEIITEAIIDDNDDTVNLKITTQNQKNDYAYILSLHPSRIILIPVAASFDMDDLAATTSLQSF